MTRTPSSWLVLLAVTSGSACGDTAGSGAGGQFDVDAARAEVLAAEDAMNQAVDGLDCQTGMTFMADAEPLFVSSGNVVRTGSELAGICEQMVGPRSGAVFSIDARSARILSDSAALVVREGAYTINFLDGTSQEIHLVMSTVWERGADGWRMVHLHESSRPPAG